MSATLPRPCVGPEAAGCPISLFVGSQVPNIAQTLPHVFDIRDRYTYHGIRTDDRGVFENRDGDTYAGQCKDGYACGLGVLTRSYGHKVYAEHGPDGQFDGRCLHRNAYWGNGGTDYRLYERGKEKESALVLADGRCKYNNVACAPDDPRLLALIAQVAPVEVRPAAPATNPPIAAHSHPGNRPMDRPARFAPRRRRRLPWPPRCIPTPHAVAGGRATPS